MVSRERFYLFAETGEAAGSVKNIRHHPEFAVRIAERQIAAAARVLDREIAALQRLPGMDSGGGCSENLTGKAANRSRRENQCCLAARTTRSTILAPV